ncbi:BQ5605_C006g04271 [Microbotryum silenes-dioicae]|uniref:BQ5605_C006g04271 protein n=1 Tax=Microbotryum silenes-dioicae TaxID=796604 RepID=A0A2X0P910_9BASI|nr:BQ5605_C006g04271 [Microbotryum silenes-dioicae]
MPAACNIATNSTIPSSVLFECQPSSCFFTGGCGRVDFVRLRIRVHGTLNKTRSVNSGSPSRGRSSTARFGGVTVVLTGDPKQCLPVILNGSVWWRDRRVGRPATTTARARAFRSGPTQFFASPCLYRINIDVCEVVRGARRRT